MRPELIIFLAFVASFAGALIVLLRHRRRSLTRERLAPLVEADDPDASPPEARRVLRRMRWLPWVVGIAVVLILHSAAVGLFWVYSLAIGLLIALLGGQLELISVERRTHLIETQLADSIDLMVGALRAGAGVLNSLSNAAHETRMPLREQLDEVVGRIRLGDNAQEVFQELVERVPLETFMLFASALSVHWEVGGSLAPTLATVGRTIRDRIELTRRLRSMSAQSRMSIIGVLLATYAIAAVMWANDPQRMQRFLVSDYGSDLVAGVVILQGIGIVWTSSLARIKL